MNENTRPTPMQTFALGGPSWTTPVDWRQGGSDEQALVDGATTLVARDWSEPYEVDQAEILRAADGTFLYASASGCSCWEGDWQYEQYATFDDLAAGIRWFDRKYNVGWTRSDDMLAEAARVLGIDLSKPSDD